ncbi:MAG: ATP-binding protein [Eubacterium sp.]|nr:ATP-binding protein [Eubacterium sp.]
MIGRNEEKAFLKSLLEEEEPQFIAVFGRRRIGKTYLVRESFDYHFTFEHTGISNTSIAGKSYKEAQLDKFAESLSKAGVDCGKLASWEDAFQGLEQVIEKSSYKKKVIFIDELSWMDTKNSGLISALESFWNGWATARKQKDVVLIVCASATYWMIDNIVNAKGGLHNRLTGQIFLQPFTLRECEQYLESRKILFNRHQILQCYMIMGGVPYYWSLLQKGKSLPQNIDRLFFKENGPLKNEYDNLYAALFKKPETYMQIVEILSTAGKGMSREDISKKAKIPLSGDFSKKLTELENCGFIRKYVPYGYKKRNALYQLIDNFTLFYYKFMRQNVFDENIWESRVNSPSVHAWSGIAFERVCLEHIKEIKKALGISGVETSVNAWQCSKNPEKGIFGSQIDLLIARKDQVINVCEMKYAEAEYKVDEAFDRSMRHKISDLVTMTGTKYAIYPTLITTYGVMETAYAGNLQSVITSDQLFG